MSTTLLAVLAGACYSAAYVCPPKLCALFLVASMALVLWSRGI